MNAKETKQLGREIIACFAEAQIAAGVLDPAGKTAVQIALEAKTRALSDLRKGQGRLHSISHQKSLLDHARSLKRANELEAASLFYATWIEHWINFFLIRWPSNLRDSEILQAIRDVPLRGKLSWLLSALGCVNIPRYI